MAANRPRSELFLSVDVVGSTQYKQRQNAKWQDTFLAFYRQFPQVLAGVTTERGPSVDFKLWKPVGDELIFTCIVEHERDIYDAVRVWIEAMDQYDTTLAKNGLATKGGAFVATFPGPDSESSVPRDPFDEDSDKSVAELNRLAHQRRNNTKYVYDYFGPSIDTGFRVFGACDSRHFTLSVEVAWAMSRCATESGVNNSEHHLDDVVLMDTRHLKGVWSGRDYPIFAIDRKHTDLVHQALRKIRDTTVSAADVQNLCKECSNAPGWPSKLYLPKSGVDSFKQVPVDPFDAIQDNIMEGAESAPSEIDGLQPLEPAPPMR